MHRIRDIIRRARSMLADNRNTVDITSVHAAHVTELNASRVAECDAKP